MAQIGTISLSGIFHEDAQYTFLLASGITEADVGKAVALDTSAANTVKLAGDGDAVLGRLEIVEDRVNEGILVGTVATQGGYRFPVTDGLDAADVPDVGEYAHGGGDGGVKGSATASNWLVVEVASDDSYVVAIKV